MGLSLTPVTHVSASPPFHPGRSVLPSPVGDNSLSSETLPLQPETQVLAHIRPWTNWFDLWLDTYWGCHRSPALQSGRCFLCVPAVAESPFARFRCYLRRRGVSHPVGERYLPFLAPTDSCASPMPSCWLCFLVPQVCAGCRKSLLGIAPSRRYLCESFPTCLDPYPGCSRGAFTRFFPPDFGLPHR